MTYDGDPKIINTGDGSDLNVVGGQPEMDEGIENAVHLSIFTSAGWWGNAVAKSESERFNSEFETINRRTLNNQARLDAEEYAKRALAWMVTDGVADRISVAASIPAVGVLGLVIQVVQPSGPTTIRYQINWSEFGIRVGAA